MSSIIKQIQSLMVNRLEIDTKNRNYSYIYVITFALAK